MNAVIRVFADLLEMLSTEFLVHQDTPESKETRVVTAFLALLAYQGSMGRRVTLESVLPVAQALKATEETED